jgi:hypothetical protein
VGVLEKFAPRLQVAARLGSQIKDPDRASGLSFVAHVSTARKLATRFSQNLPQNYLRGN